MNQNQQIILAGFQSWTDGTGSFFDLLSEDVEWTISGSSPLSKIYKSKKALLDEVIDPLNERLAQKIVPHVRESYADGEVVIVIWDGNATAKDGQSYDVSYAWFMTMKEGKIVKVTAFLDTLDFADIFKRIK